MTSPAPDTGRTADENELREALATELASVIYGGGMISPLAFATRLLSGPLAPILQEAAHLRAENANLRDRVREAEGAGRGPSDTGSHPAGGTPDGFPSLRDVDPSRSPADADPPRPFKEVLPEAYGWLVDAKGYLWGLTAGDMGYDQTDMRLVDLFDLAIEAEWHRFKITHEKKWPVHEITLDFISTLAAALGIEAAVPPKPKGSAEGESPSAPGGMPDPLSPEPQEAGDGR